MLPCCPWCCNCIIMTHYSCLYICGCNQSPRQNAHCKVAPLLSSCCWNSPEEPHVTGQFNLNLQETSNHHLHAADSQTLHSSWRFWNFLKFWSSQTEYWSSNFRSYKLCACCVVIIASTSSHMISRSHFEACTHTQLQVKNQEPVVSSKLVIRVQFVNDRWIFSVAHIYVIKSPLSSKPTKKFHSNFFYLLVSGQCDVTVTGPSLACIIFGVH